MNGVLKSILADTLQARSMGDGVGEAFSWISKPFLQFYPITPVLQHSTTPSTPGSEGTRSAPLPGAPDKATSSGRGFFTAVKLLARPNEASLRSE